MWEKNISPVFQSVFRKHSQLDSRRTDGRPADDKNSFTIDPTVSPNSSKCLNRDNLFLALIISHQIKQLAHVVIFRVAVIVFFVAKKTNKRKNLMVLPVSIQKWRSTPYRSNCLSRGSFSDNGLQNVYFYTRKFKWLSVWLHSKQN